MSEKASGDSESNKEGMPLEKKKALEKEEEQSEKQATDAKESKAPEQEEHHEKTNTDVKEEHKAPEQEEHGEKATNVSTEHTPDVAKSETNASDAVMNTTLSERKDEEVSVNESAAESGSAKDAESTKKDAESTKKKSWFSWFKR